jgi:UDP-galactopyranose mutase
MPDDPMYSVEVRLNTVYCKDMSALADKVIYTGAIDEYYGYIHGALSYRSLKFESEQLQSDNYQGCAVMNYTDSRPYTRIIEHKHFEFGTQPTTIITREYPVDWKLGDEPYYPVCNDENNALYQKYASMQDDKVYFGGMLGSYCYLNIDQVIEEALKLVGRLL